MNAGHERALEPPCQGPIQIADNSISWRGLQPHDMLSVIIPTRNSERALVPTLAALVPGATAGIIAEVLIADGGSQDETAAVADVAGCNFLIFDGSYAGSLRAAVSAARMPWLMFLRPGIVLDAPWTSEVARFVQQEAQQAKAAVFRRGGRQNALHEVLRAAATALGAPPHPEQGLLIAKHLYDIVGGHSERSGDPEHDLLRRVGRRRIVKLTTQAFGGS